MADESATTGKTESTPTAPTAADGAPFTQTVGRIVLALAAAAFVAFALFNVQAVEINWFSWQTETPLIVALLLTFVLGLIVGWGATVRSHRRSRRHDAGTRRS